MHFELISTGLREGESLCLRDKYHHIHDESCQDLTYAIVGLRLLFSPGLRGFLLVELLSANMALLLD